MAKKLSPKSFNPHIENNNLILEKADYASLSYDAYHREINPEYKHITYDFKNTAQPTGYFARAHIFAKKNTNQCHIIIAHRGTNGILDLTSNLGIFLQQTPEQIKYAKSFMEDVKDHCIKNGFAIQNIEHTGHSLGGVLAGIMGATNNQKATLFDSPGLKEIIQKYGYTALENAKNKIDIYIGQPNIINSLHNHIGNVIVNNNIKSHGIANFI